MKLELAILSKDHESNTVGREQTLICLREHIKLANSKLDTPFTKVEITKITQSILKFMHNMTKHRSLDEINGCNDLIYFLNVIPEPEELMYY